MHNLLIFVQIMLLHNVNIIYCNTILLLHIRRVVIIITHILCENMFMHNGLVNDILYSI